MREVVLIYMWLAIVATGSSQIHRSWSVIKTGSFPVPESVAAAVLDSNIHDANFLTTLGDDHDLTHSARLAGDELLLREALINDPASTQRLYWFGYFSAPLTQVKVLNPDKQGRTLWVSSVNSLGRAEVVVEVPENCSVEVVVEVYGFQD